MTSEVNTKPKKQAIECYRYDEIISWIESKYNIKTRDFAAKFQGVSNEKYADLIKQVPPTNGEPPYLDFWHHLIETVFYNDVHNGCYRTIPLRKDEDYPQSWDERPAWFNAILKMIDDEFPEENGEIEVFIEW